MKKSLAFFCLCALTSTLLAKTPTEFVVPHAPGGVSDITARLIERGLPVGKYVVVNKPGGGSQIAVNYVMQRPSLLLATATQVFVNNLFTFKDLSYDPDRDLDIVATVGIVPSVLICNRRSNIKDVRDILNTDRSLSFAIAGYGSNEHLVSELLFSMSKTKHRLVPFSAGGSSGIVAVAGAHVDCSFANYPTVISFTKNPDLTLLISSHEIGGLDTKTWSQEFGRAFPLQSYLVVAVSNKLDPTIKKQIKKDLALSFANPDVVSGLTASGLFVQAGVDEKFIRQAVSANLSARKFIQANQIDLQGK